jgi:hypothetical protein
MTKSVEELTGQLALILDGVSNMRLFLALIKLNRAQLLIECAEGEIRKRRYDPIQSPRQTQTSPRQRQGV